MFQAEVIGMNLRRIFSVGSCLLLVFNLAVLFSAWGEEKPFDWPVKGKVTVGYLQKYSNVEDGKKYTHHGIDVQVPTGSQVTAAGDGKVSFAGFTPAGGGTVSIIHPNGYKTTYLQLAQISVSEGEEVTKGKAIAIVAASGDKSLTEPHLHFGVKEVATDKYVDPESLLPLILVEKEPSPSSAKTETVLSTPTIVEETPASPTPVLSGTPSLANLAAQVTQPESAQTKQLEPALKASLDTQETTFVERNKPSDFKLLIFNQVRGGETSLASQEATPSLQNAFSLPALPGGQLALPNDLAIAFSCLPDSSFGQHPLRASGIFPFPPRGLEKGATYQSPLFVSGRLPSLESLKITLAIFALLTALALLIRRFYNILKLIPTNSPMN